MKIIQLEAQNVKRLKAIEIRPDGNLVVIGGKNGAGKSSVLDSIAYVLGGKDAIPSQPVRKGEKKATVVCELDNLIVKRTITATGGGTLTVENKEGAVFKSPQAMLDALCGELTFDPLEFSRMSARKQAETLKGLVGLDFSELENERQSLYDERTRINTDGKALKARFEGMQEYPEAPERIEDVFKESGVRAYFEEKALDDMSLETDTPIKQEELNTFNGIIRIYKPPIVGHRYIVYTDPSLGVEDPFVTRVKDCATGERVASACGTIKVDFAAQIHDYLVRTYNKAWNSFEYNGSAGGEFASVLKDLNTPNISARRDHEGKIVENRKGLYITPQLKKQMMERLNYLVAKRQIINHDKEYISQARKVLRDNDLPVMDKHQSFDWVMADAGLEWVDKFVPKGNVYLKTIRDI